MNLTNKKYSGNANLFLIRSSSLMHQQEQFEGQNQEAQEGQQQSGSHDSQKSNPESDKQEIKKQLEVKKVNFLTITQRQNRKNELKLDQLIKKIDRLTDLFTNDHQRIIQQERKLDEENKRLLIRNKVLEMQVQALEEKLLHSNKLFTRISELAVPVYNKEQFI